MEEVDSIIIHFLRQLDVNISENIKNITELPVETIIESASKCLMEINNSIKLPMKLPSGISHRIEVASQIASICKDLGYKNDVGYQSFLYYNEAELRQIFMFLIENLPNKDQQHTKISNDHNKSFILQKIGLKINEELNSVWIPPCCKASVKQMIGDFVYKPVNWNKNCDTYPLNEEYLVKKLRKIKLDNGNYKENILSSEVMTDPQSINLKIPMDVNKSLKELKELSILLHQKLDSLESERHMMDVEYSQALKSCDKVNAEMKNVKNILKSIESSETENNTVDNITETVQINITKLHKMSEDLTSKNLCLKIELDNIKNKMDSSESARTKCKKTLAVLKENAKSLKEEYEDNEETKNQLKKVYEISKGGNKRQELNERKRNKRFWVKKCIERRNTLGASSTLCLELQLEDEESQNHSFHIYFKKLDLLYKKRHTLRQAIAARTKLEITSIYTKRILEIISNVDKQNMEIKKILEDTRQLQKEINNLEGQLDRCFSIADETLFRDAKKDDQAKKAYKLLALLHSECSTIVSLVNDTGAMERDIVDLEDNIETEKAKRTEDTLKKIHLDLSKMQQECINSDIM